MLEFINKLKSINRGEPNSYIRIKKLFNEALNFDYYVSDIKKGTLLHRATINDENTSDVENISRLSYRTDLENIKNFGRANEPNQSIFYCADRDFIAIKEVSNLNRNYCGQMYEYEIITSSIWRVIEDISVVSIFGNSNARILNELTKTIGCTIEESYRTHFGENADEYIMLLNYLSGEYIANVGDDLDKYKISCAFANTMYSRPDVDGVSYPSVQSCGFGINSALVPEKINNKIEFVSARRNSFILDNNRKYFPIEIKNSKSTENEKIYWSESIKF